MAIIAQNSSLAQEFLSRLPQYPLAGMVWSARHGGEGSPALHHVSRKALEFFDTIQVSTTNRKAFLVVDLDAEAPTPSDDIPLPNIITIAPTGHAHLVWILEREVFAKEGGSSAPMRVWEEKQRFLTETIGGDAGFTGFTTLNPLYKGFKSVSVRSDLCKLSDFPADYTIPKKRMDNEVVPRHLLEGVGEGYRNSLLFEYARQRVYSVRWAYTDYQSFFQGVLEICQEANNLFAVPLGEREVIATAKSIAGWTWEHMIPSKKFVLGGHTVITDEMRKKAGANLNSRANLSARCEEVARIANERRAEAWRLYTEGKSYKQIAEVMGGSPTTIRKYIWEAKKTAPAPAPQRLEGEVDLPGIEA